MHYVTHLDISMSYKKYGLFNNYCITYYKQCYCVKLQNLCCFNSETCEDFKTLLLCKKKKCYFMGMCQKMYF